MLKDSNMNGLRDHLGAVLLKLVELGFEEPIMFVALGANGSVLAGSFAGSEFTMSAERYFDGGMALPINMMFVDSKSGEAARVFLQRPDQEEYTINLLSTTQMHFPPARPVHVMRGAVSGGLCDEIERTYPHLGDGAERRTMTAACGSGRSI